LVSGAIGCNLVASPYQVCCDRPANGDRFISRTQVARAGKQQIFATAELFVVRGDKEHL
jgi:hypothetical protein